MAQCPEIDATGTIESDPKPLTDDQGHGQPDSNRHAQTSLAANNEQLHQNAEPDSVRTPKTGRTATNNHEAITPDNEAAWQWQQLTAERRRDRARSAASQAAALASARRFMANHELT